MPIEERAVKVGIYLDLRNPPQWERPWAAHYARSLELCEEAERLGAASVWISEHHLFEDGYLPQPLTFAAAVAARTTRVRIGTAVLLAALRHPVQIVEEANVVDLVSEARIREIQRLWEERSLTPPPVQDPIPVWGGFQGPRGARLAGRLGLRLLTLDRRLLAPYVEGLAEAGVAAGAARMGGVVNMVLADDPEAAWPRIAPHLAYQWDSYNRYMVEDTDQPVPRPIDPERWRAPGREGAPPRFQVLTAEDAATALRERTDGLPVEHVYLWASIAGMPDDLVARHVELVSGTLAPMLA
jgi:alkanesulfonate monooxygenase SsuD/methylene tetrahydromethanopterin reductase-like flavin-dependent oxidoreductase (luciferase family)